jgi:hypothetical protein
MDGRFNHEMRIDRMRFSTDTISRRTAAGNGISCPFGKGNGRVPFTSRLALLIRTCLNHSCPQMGDFSWDNRGRQRNTEWPQTVLG